MDMREDVGDSPPLISGQFNPPRSGIEMFEDDLIHPLVYGVALHQYLAGIDANVSL
jgi:hypothetical protein